MSCYCRGSLTVTSMYTLREDIWPLHVASSCFIHGWTADVHVYKSKSWSLEVATGTTAVWSSEASIPSSRQGTNW